MLIRTPGPHRQMEKMRRKREWRRRRSRTSGRATVARHSLLEGLSAVAVSLLGLRRHFSSLRLAPSQKTHPDSFGGYPSTRMHGALFEAEYYGRFQPGQS